MRTLRRTPVLRTLAVAGTTAMLSTAAFAAVESSCPAPCDRPPKTALFVRDAPASLQANGDIPTVYGTLLRGSRNTVLRIDASVLVKSDVSVPGVYVTPRLNGYLPVTSGVGARSFPCISPDPTFCAATGAFWFDIDALEAAHPGEFIGQPLNIAMDGGNVGSAGGGLQCEATFSAQVVKKK